VTPAPPYSSLPKLKRVAKQIADAVDTVIADYRGGRIGHEEDITACMVQAIKDAVRSRRRSSSASSGVTWGAMILKRSHGLAAEESRHGADLLAVAEISYGSNVVAKGFLGQAKRIEPGNVLPQAEWDRLQDQVGLMLDRTAAAFVLLYSQHYGVRFAPALTVAQVARSDLYELNAQPLREFFEWHLACFIGDRRLDDPHIRTLDGLRALPALRDLPIENILRLIVTVEGR
jgi:hypothetical protein